MKVCKVSVACHLGKRDNTELICFMFVNPQDNMISDMTVVLQ